MPMQMQSCNARCPFERLQGYLAHKKHPRPRTAVVLGEGAVSYKRGTSVACLATSMPPMLQFPALEAWIQQAWPPLDGDRTDWISIIVYQ